MTAAGDDGGLNGPAGPNLDLPFELAPAGQVQPIDDDALIAGGVVVMAVVATVAGRPTPGVMYRFARPDGSGFYPPVLLVQTSDQLGKLKKLTYEAVNAAVRRAALAARGEI